MSSAQRDERRRVARREGARVGQRVAIDLGLVADGAKEHVGVEADHRIAAARGAAFDRFEQEGSRRRARATSFR